MTPLFHCPCSRDRAIRTLGLLESHELEELIREERSQEIVCDFCGRAYEIEPLEMRPLVEAMRPG